jgi:hypothetical protein
MCFSKLVMLFHTARQSRLLGLSQLVLLAVEEGFLDQWQLRGQGLLVEV